jgi:arginine decarboxylase
LLKIALKLSLIRVISADFSVIPTLMLKSFPQLRDQTTIPLENNHQLETLSVESNQSIHNSEELYGLNRWGKPYFRINNLGHITVSPQGVGDKEVDLFKLVEVLESRDINLPLLIHFPDIIEDRIKKLNLCFTQAITKYEYEGSYQGVFSH